jgi:hypothetical protein
MAYTTALPTQPMQPAQARAWWYLVERPVTCRTNSKGKGHVQMDRQQ